MEQLYTVKETAGILKVSRATLYRLIDRGLLRSVKIGRKTLFTEEELKNLIDKMKEESRKTFS